MTRPARIIEATSPAGILPRKFSGSESYSATISGSRDTASAASLRRRRRGAKRPSNRMMRVTIHGVCDVALSPAPLNSRPRTSGRRVTADNATMDPPMLWPSSHGVAPPCHPRTRAMNASTSSRYSLNERTKTRSPSERPWPRRSSAWTA